MLKRITLLLLVAGCGGKTIEPLEDGGDSDGGVKKDVVVDVGPPIDAFPTPTDGAPQQCNNIDPGTKTISVSMVAQDPPPFASSSASIQPGLYELDMLTIWTGPNGPSGNSGSIAGEIRVNAANSAEYIFQVATVQDNQAPMHQNADVNNAGAGVIAIAQTCPSTAGAVKVPYEADSSSFTFRVTTSSQTADEKFAYIGP